MHPEASAEAPPDGTPPDGTPPDGAPTEPLLKSERHGGHERCGPLPAIRKGQTTFTSALLRLPLVLKSVSV
ncbi:hypothetical protein [Telluribacter sp.]|uniref:hypothetical protein n=1 Tax=Telluribacter sp. TaxID=1978767 RepID=UPI002E12CB98|nr:hypothetical protein [Telluribacter sp.]